MALPVEVKRSVTMSIFHVMVIATVMIIIYRDTSSRVDHTEIRNVLAFPFCLSYVSLKYISFAMPGGLLSLNAERVWYHRLRVQVLGNCRSILAKSSSEKASYSQKPIQINIIAICQISIT